MLDLARKNGQFSMVCHDCGRRSQTDRDSFRNGQNPIRPDDFAGCGGGWRIPIKRFTRLHQSASAGRRDRKKNPAHRRRDRVRAQPHRGAQHQPLLNIAIIVPDIANPFFPPMIKAAQEDADSSGFCVFLGNSDEDPAREDQLLARFLGQVEGFILVSSRMSEQRIRHYVDRCPLVLVNRDIKGLPRVLIDSGPGVSEAVHHLAAHGHKSIAYLSGPKRSWSNTQRLAAIKRAGKDLGLDVSIVSATSPSYPAARNAVPRLVKTGATAIVSFDDLTAQGIIAGLDDQDSVPRISVVDDDVLGRHHPASPPYRAGRKGHCSFILLDFAAGNTATSAFARPTWCRAWPSRRRGVRRRVSPREWSCRAV